MARYRSDQALIHVSVAGVGLDAEPWDLFEGGEKKTAGLKVWPGGMKDQEELGGTPEREPIKVARKWDDILINAFKALDDAASNTPAEVSVTTLNAQKLPTGPTTTYSGVLLDVKRPTYKSGPAEESVLELTIGPHGGIQ